MLRVASPLRAQLRGRRGGRAGDVARRAQRARALRGPRLAEDVDLPHPHQPRDQPGGARGAHVPFPLSRVASRPSTPIASAPRATATRAGGRRSRELGALPEERLLARETLALVGEAIARAPRAPAPRDPDARHRGLERRARSASRSRSARPTSGYCCTVPARRSAACSSPTSSRS